MDTRSLWEDHVDGLTKHCQRLDSRIEDLEGRLTFFENVVVVLIKALKDGGVIVEKSDGENS